MLTSPRSRHSFRLLSLLLFIATASAQDAPIDPSLADFVKKFKGKGAVGDPTLKALGPEEALRNFKVIDGLEMELVAAEPLVRQPLNLHFDERGRLWVVQYLQYPFPAGLKIVKYDQYLRAVFDKVPEPPPRGKPGADKITILEDTDGDGTFESHKDFVTGLNIATSVCVGRGGVWVMNPPYLLFYPDKNRDDVPDGDPQVVLSGFGLEDTHSIATSLHWGPDGWLYGANGSTTTGTVKGVHWLGQMIWRVHPETHEFEVFAEGGGNTMSLTFDSHGRAFSGTNHGATRGMYYPQGSAGIKNWGKHGPLMNPYSFGWFEHMAHEGYQPRFAQAFMIYEGGAIPQLEGAVIAPMSLMNRVLASKLDRDTSTFRTTDSLTLVETEDKGFRPVDVRLGPDGAIYMADWCDIRLTHVDPRDTWDRSNGRVYRLQAKGTPPVKPFDIGKMSNAELIALLSHPNQWWRQTAQRVLADRHDASLSAELRQLVEKEKGQLALEAFWALKACGGLDDAFSTAQLAHPNPDVRTWAIRVVGDTRSVTPTMRDKLLALARTEPNVDVRSQLAASCKRWPAADALKIVHELLQRSEDAADKHLPLMLWWAMENNAISGRTEILAMLRKPELWKEPLVRTTLTPRIAQRYTAERTPANLTACADLLGFAPSAEDVTALLRGMDEGLRGNAVSAVPAALQKRIAKLWETREHDSTLVRVALRLGHGPATPDALAFVADSAKPEAERRQLVSVLSEQSIAAAVPMLLERFHKEKSETFRLELLNALQRFKDERIADTLLTAWPKLSAKLRASASGILATRPAWANALLLAVDTGTVKREQLAPSTVLAIRQFADPRNTPLLDKHWGRLGQSSEEKLRDIERIRGIVTTGKGDPEKGRTIFQTSCGACHTLHGEGGKIGPELTGYERDNLDFLIPAIVDPNLGIREEFTSFVLATTDGQTLTGYITENLPQSVTLVDLAQNKILIPRERIKSLTASPTSLMPEGLLAPYTDEQLRDLFAWVMKK
jgi:putative heme-binding domain-containing protein